VSTVTVPVRDPGVRRRRSHSTYRRPEPGSLGFRPGGRSVGPAAGPDSHRPRPAPIRCDDPRKAARAAAVRRRHILLGTLAVIVLLILASPLSGRGSGLADPGPVPVGTSLAAHSVYVVQQGDTLWSIAERLDPRGDPRPTVTALSTQAGGDTVRPGERLILP
jgi:nucleoid-associated protein YgaU